MSDPRIHLTPRQQAELLRLIQGRQETVEEIDRETEALAKLVAEVTKERSAIRPWRVIAEERPCWRKWYDRWRYWWAYRGS